MRYSHELIGKNAGAIWQSLSETSGQSLSMLEKNTKLKKEDILLLLLIFFLGLAMIITILWGGGRSRHGYGWVTYNKNSFPQQITNPEIGLHGSHLLSL